MKLTRQKPNVITFRDFSDKDALDLVAIIRNGIKNQQQTGVSTCPAKIKIILNTFTSIFTLSEYLSDITAIMNDGHYGNEIKIPRLIIYTNSNKKDFNKSIRIFLSEFNASVRVVDGYIQFTPIPDELINGFVDSVALWVEDRITFEGVTTVMSHIQRLILTHMHKRQSIISRCINFSSRAVIIPDPTKRLDPIKMPKNADVCRTPVGPISYCKSSDIVLIDITDQHITAIADAIAYSQGHDVSGNYYTMLPDVLPKTIRIILSNYDDLNMILRLVHTVDSLKEKYDIKKRPRILLYTLLSDDYSSMHLGVGDQVLVTTYINMLIKKFADTSCKVLSCDYVSKSLSAKISNYDKVMVEGIDNGTRLLYSGERSVLRMINLAIMNDKSTRDTANGEILPGGTNSIHDRMHLISLRPTHIVEPRQCEFDGDILNVIRLDDDERTEKKKELNINYGEKASRYVGSSTLTDEEHIIHDAILAARKTEEFLWAEYNGKWDIEEWRRMFRKRICKIDEIDVSRPHAKIELKKRLLQNAALSIALLNIIDNADLPEKCDVPSNLPEYKNGVIFSLINMSNAYIGAVHLTEDDGCDINEIIRLLMNGRLSLLVNGNNYDTDNIDVIDDHTLRIKGLEKFDSVHTIELRCKEGEKKKEDTKELSWIKDNWDRNGAIEMPSVLYLLDQISFNNFSGLSTDWILIKPIFNAIFKGDKSEMISCIKEIMAPHKINFFIGTCTKLYEKING